MGFKQALNTEVMRIKRGKEAVKGPKQASLYSLSYSRVSSQSIPNNTNTQSLEVAPTNNNNQLAKVALRAV